MVGGRQLIVGRGFNLNNSDVQELAWSEGNYSIPMYMFRNAFMSLLLADHQISRGSAVLQGFAYIEAIIRPFACPSQTFNIRELTQCTVQKSSRYQTHASAFR
jgi:hypothetical protein